MFARVEGMAVRANLYLNVLFRGSCFNDVPANTADGRLLIFWMDSLFHRLTPLPNRL